MTIDLSGQSILVTGAGRGIGKAIADSLAASGAVIAAHYRRTRPGDGERIIPIQADLATLDEADRLFDDAIGALGRIDTLVLNAGIAISAPLSASRDVWRQAWDQTMAVNLRASEWLSRRLIGHARQRPGPSRIVYISSRAAFRGDTLDYMAYAASKAGMVALARSVARGCGKEGVRAFVVAPGFTRTDMAADFIEQYGEEHALESVATDRLTEPKDLVPMVTLLVSGLADHATGCTIDVNAASYVH